MGEKPPLEKDIQREICDWLAFNRYFFWRSNNFPALGRPDKSGQMRFRALPKYTPKGLPDILVLHEGEFLGLEVKRPQASLREEQIEFGEKIREHGGHYAVVRHLDEAILKVKAVWRDPSGNSARQTDE